MDPDGTIYFILNFIISFILCLYIGTVIKNEQDFEGKLGVPNNRFSGFLLFLLNFWRLVYDCFAKIQHLCGCRIRGIICYGGGYSAILPWACSVRKPRGKVFVQSRVIFYKYFKSHGYACFDVSYTRNFPSF